MPDIIPHLNYELKTYQSQRIHQAMLQAICSLVRLVLEQTNQPSMSILDVGCGRGELLQSLVQIPQVSAQGIDLDPTCIELSRQFASCRVGSVEALDQYYSPDSFDLVIASHVLEHVPNPTLALLQLASVSRNWVLIALPNPVRPSRLLQYLKGKLYADHPTHCQVWDPGHLANFIETFGHLKVYQWQPDIVTVIPGQLLSVPLLRFILKPFSIAETTLLTGLFPLFSSSLIVLATKHRD
ncbi:MAG: class I SAM-dependent methyltransferase [Coleofasciculus sp. B1-GNL1-01]|uniref:methyltransferase domain-containing protein n=1 Tax=Coleofasciculus sp. B1-GNL1-01 TaxID=3068484 RepID=UPI0032F1DA97